MGRRLAAKANRMYWYCATCMIVQIVESTSI
jgi:hypothetical protein